MSEYFKVTDEMIKECQQKSLCQIAESLGFHIVGRGKTVHLKEMDSLVIFKDSSYYRFSENKGGDQIGFCMRFGDMNFLQAVKYILGENINNYTVSQIEEEKVEFKLPRRSKTERLLYTYLIGRGFLRKTIDQFKAMGLIYEGAAHHDVILVSLDKDKVPRHAHSKGTNPKKIRLDIPGSNKRYGFNIRNSASDTLFVFEAALDLMSYCQITKNVSDNFLALGGVAPNALNQFLADEPNIKNVVLCLDADEPGINGAIKIANEILLPNGYNVSSLLPLGAKDWNESLQLYKDSASKHIAVNPLKFN